jgi:putative ABC transport system permease protein
MTDIVYAIRSLRKSPSFSLTAVLTLGLGIGASAAIFSVVNAVLLRPLPYRDADRLVYIWSDLQNRGVRDFGHPPGDLFDMRQQTTVFDGLASVNTENAAVTVGDAEPERVPVAFITPNFFSLIGANVVGGADFVEADGQPLSDSERATAAPQKVILSYEFWQRRFGGNANAVGSTMQYGQDRALVIGVAEPHVELLFPPDINMQRTPAMWAVARLDFVTSSRTSISLRIIGRLKPGVTLQQAQGQVNAVTADLRKRFPIKDSAGLYHRVERVHDDLVADVRMAILVLMGAGVFLLLIACSNVANLLLIRAAGRERELAIRAAIGGSRSRLVRQLVIESLVLSAAGVVLGVGVAAVGVDALLALSPSVLPRLDTVSVDRVVVIFASLVGVLSAVFFGTAPALRASRPDVIDLLRAGGRSAGPSGSRLLRSAVVIGEVALSLVLLIGAGLMVRSFASLIRVDVGFDPANSLTFTLSNAHLRGDVEREAFKRRLQEELRAIPGVADVTAASPLPLDGNASAGRWGTLAALANPAEFQQATYYSVLPGYFEVVGATLIEGRTFVENDNRGDRPIVIIDDVLAAKAFPNQSPIGQQLLVRPGAVEPVPYEVVGVVRHQRHASLAGQPREALFLTDRHMGQAANRWVVRTTGEAGALATAVREAVRRVNPQLIVAELQPWTAFVDRATAPTRFGLFLISVFAGIAVILAAVGLYSVVSTTVRQRTAEIGVRMAFGATAGSILRMVLSLGLRLTIVGIGFGIAIAVGTTRLMQSMLTGVKPTDPATFVTIALVFLLVAAFACALPARRAARMSPISALRDQ